MNNKTENSGNPWDEPTRVVRGWLICVEGSRRGADFKIYGQKNTIGRGIENDIVLDFDSTVSRDVNAVVACDIRKNKFYLYQGNAKNNVYYNDDLLLTPVELKDYDIIEIGETKLMFKALCNDVFSWESLDAGKNDNK